MLAWKITTGTAETLVGAKLVRELFKFTHDHVVGEFDRLLDKRNQWCVLLVRT